VDQQSAYFAALLRSLGCTAQASVFAELFDDDVAVQRELKALDLARELVARFVREVPARGAALGEGSCEVSASLGRTLGLPGARSPPWMSCTSAATAGGFPPDGVAMS
jgi:hypothetical protein